MKLDIIEEYNRQCMGGRDQSQYEPDRKRVVMLLAAGFSVSQGYPLGGDICQNIRDLTKEQFAFDYVGGIHSANESDSTLYNLDDINNKAYNFLVESINLYVQKIGEENFNYEDFYDVIEIERNVERKDNILGDDYRKIGESYVKDDVEYRQLVCRLPMIFNQIVEFLLRDKNGMYMYDDVSCQMDAYPEYINFLKFLADTSKSNVVDVFTLNHDLLFESFNNVVGLEGKISDGFDDFGSEYFASIRVESCDYRCRLERYTGKYDAPIRLYKLHGSLDYVPFYRTVKTKSIPYAIPQNYIKIKKGIRPFAVEKARRCKRRYDDSLYPYVHADFLSGTKVKITKYKNIYLYSKLHRHFRNALKQADLLIIIGYGGGDKIISEHLSTYFDCRSKQAYIIDYKPNEKVRALGDELDAKFLVGKMDEQIKLVNI